jgi:hypothetical protein
LCSSLTSPGIPLTGENYRIKLRPEDDALVLAQRMLRSKAISKPGWPNHGPISYPDTGWM